MATDSEIKRKSILVCGAGPVGLTAAVELARRGLSPRIVDGEAGPAPLTESRALAVNARSLALLTPSGAAAEIVAKAQHIKAMRIRSRGRLLLTFNATAIKGPYKGIHGLPQGMTERILLGRLEALGVQPEWNTVVTGIGPDPAMPEAHLRKPNGQEETLRCDILVDAEGAHSIVRKMLGIGFPGESVENAFYLADYRYDRPIDTSFGEAVFFNPGVFARLPVGPDTLRYVSTMANFAELVDHPAPVAEVPWKTEFHVSYRHADPMSKGNIFLVGDAAHIHSPVGGRGMNLGIEDACWLAWLIGEGREQEYSGFRVKTAHTVLGKTHQLTRMVTLENPLAIAARNIGLPLLTRIPAVREGMLRSISGFDTPAPPWLER